MSTASTVSAASKLSPYERIAARYAENPQDYDFEDYLHWHFVHGFVHSTPRYFVMGRAVQLGTDFTEHLRVCEKGLEDCWYVHAMAGDMRRAWEVLPYELPYIAFERVRGGKRELTIVEAERIRRMSASC